MAGHHLRPRGRVVGRDDERALLLSVARASTDGTGAAALVVGPAGVGKSRLVDDAAIRAAPAVVLRVQGAEDAVEVPFSGLVRAVAPLRRSPSWSSDIEGLPRLHALWPGDVASPPASADPELERASVVYAVVELLRRLARRGSILLVVDDLQWVDRATRDVLGQLGTVAQDHPVVVLATARSDLVRDPDRDHAGRPGNSTTRWMDAWPTVTRLELTRLSDDHADAMLRDLLASDPPAELAQLAHDHAGGVPLYLRALVFALAESGVLRHGGREWFLTGNPLPDVPATVHQLVLDRLALRDDADRAVLQTLALGRADVPHDVVAAAVDLPAQELLAVLGRLTSAGLVIEDADDDVVFRVEHPLVRHAVASSLGVLARRRLHARLFHCFAELHPAALGDQAEHAVAAGTEVDPARALPILLRVLRSAAVLDDAVDLALAARRLALRPPRRTVELVEALELLGQAHQYRGDLERAGSAWDEALEHAQDVSPTALARLHRRRALLAWDRLEAQVARRHLHRALAVLGPDDPERAAVLHARLLVSDPGADPAVVADDLADLRALQDEPERLQVEALLGRCWVELNAGRFEKATTTARSVLSSDATREDPATARRAHLEMTLACWMSGDHRGLASHAAQAAAVDARFATSATQAQTDFRLGVASVMAGDPVAAAGRLGHAVAAAEDVGFDRVTVACRGVLVAALTLLGDLAGARRELRRARAAASDVENSRAMLLVEWGAATLAVDGASSDEVDIAHDVVPVGWEHFPPFAVLAARHAHRVGNVAALRRVRAAVGPSDGPYAAAAGLLTAGLAAGLDRSTEGAPLLREAAARFDALDLPRETAIARHHAGDVDSLFLALEGFRRLGDRRWSARCRTLLRAEGVSAASLRDPPRPDATLTSRELEVADLVAAGHTNAAVARELAVSVRTVTAHLEHIYRRLGLRSRAALATWFHERGGDP